jgi:hypothetical protein
MSTAKQTTEAPTTPPTIGAYRSAAEVAAALAKEIDPADILEREGQGGKMFGYVAWDRSRDLLDTIFGPLGWSVEEVSYSADFQQGIYQSTIRITGYMVDDNTGTIISISRTGTGRAVAEQRKNGTLNHDTAIPAAASDAFSRAAKMFGPALGSKLYDKTDPARTQPSTTNYTPRQSSAPRQSTGDGNLGPRPSAAQLPHVAKALGITEAEVATTPFDTWRPALDAYFQNGKKPVGNPQARVPARAAATAVAEADEDYPF